MTGLAEGRNMTFERLREMPASGRLTGTAAGTRQLAANAAPGYGPKLALQQRHRYRPHEAERERGHGRRRADGDARSRVLRRLPGCGCLACGGVQRLLVKGRRDRQNGPLAERPDHHKGPADYVAFRYGAAARVVAVTAGVPGHITVVAHDPQAAGRDGDAEPLLRWQVTRVQVGLLVQRHAVHGDPALRVAAGDVVAGQADHALDVVVLVLGEAEHRGDALAEPGEEVIARRRGTGIPRAVSAEHHDVAAVNAAGVIDDLVNQHAVADGERVLHRAGRDEERLDEVGLDDQGEDQGHDDQNGQFLPERPALLRGALGGALARGLGAAGSTRVRPVPPARRADVSRAGRRARSRARG